MNQLQPHSKQKLTQKTTCPAKHTNKNADHSEAAETDEAAADTAAETDEAAADTAAVEIEEIVAVAAVTGQDTKLPTC